MQIRSFPEVDVPAALRGQVLELHAQAWPGGADGHDPALRPLSMLLIEDGVVLAALDILSKRIEHAGASYAVSGLSTVVTDVRHRGRGLGRRLVSAAREAIVAGGADLGIFTCDLPLRAFYESAGWSVLPGAVLIGGTPQSPFASDQFDKVVLATFCSAEAVAAAAGFEHARIGLYPGDRDLLW
jgi:aminoglycoside 2'-N-acetyltransferase I